MDSLRYFGVRLLPLQRVIYNKAKSSLVFQNRSITAINESTFPSPKVIYYHSVSSAFFNGLSKTLGDSRHQQVVGDPDEALSVFFGHRWS